MNFLCNKQVLGILFILKIHFCIFTYFICSLDWSSFSVKRRGFRERISKTQRTIQGGLRVGFLITQGLLCKSDRRRGISEYGPIDQARTAVIKSTQVNPNSLMPLSDPRSRPHI
jgi:hypothetical protein